MFAQKLSISLNEELCEFIAMYQRQHQCKSRSEVIMKALTLLRQKHLEAEYQAAANEIDTAWDALAGDGIDADQSW